VRRLLREERGMTLTEVLIVSVLLTVVLGATVSVLDSFRKTTDTNTRLNEAQDSIRVSMGLMTRELRNLASPTNEQPLAIERAEPKDLIFRSVAGNKPAGSLNVRNARWVRYCISGSGLGTLWRQELTWTGATAPAAPAATSCPGSGWGAQRVQASNITNGGRALFSYNSATLSAITEIGVSLWLDPDPGRTPTEVSLQSSVFLRNQNRAPVAAFTAVASGGAVVLNGSDSSDPEGRSLSFYWYDANRSSNSCGELPPEIPTTGCVGKGLVFNYFPPSSGSRTVYLIAADPAGLKSQAPSKTVFVAGGDDDDD
jgi:prepilin-type N-terminal cleavage/methylation domain-containing protein